jgi:cation diffusion facilitator family transporter
MRHAECDIRYPECGKCIRNVGFVNFWANVGMMVFKLTFGLLCGSIAVVADAIHTLCDVGTSSIMILSLHVSGKKPDEDHPFGHGKIEYIGTAVVAFSMLCVATLLVSYAVIHILRGDLQTPDRIVMLVTIISILGNYLLYRHCLCVGRKANSSVIVANAYENLADSHSSIAVLIGLIGTQFGWTFLDPLAGIAIGGLILRTSIKTFIVAARGLADFGLEPETTGRIRDAVQSVEGVMGIDRIRGRHIGQQIEVGLRVKVPANETVEWTREVAHHIQDAVRPVVKNAESINISFLGVEGS